MTTETGVRLPAREVCALVHRRCPARPLGFDGAQAAGQFPIDLGALGCDFYTATGYKWLLGHRGTSFLYVRPAWIQRLRPSWSGPGAALPVGQDPLAWAPLPTASRFEFGGRDRPVYGALGEAVGFVAGAGPPAIEARSAALAGRLKAALADVPGVTVLTPRDPAASTGIVTVALAGWTGHGPDRHAPAALAGHRPLGLRRPRRPLLAGLLHHRGGGRDGDRGDAPARAVPAAVADEPAHERELGRRL